MLTPAAIRGFTRATPFQPFRVKMASGECFDVRHPETLVFAGNHVTLADDAGRTIAVSMMLMESLRPVQAETGRSKP